MQEHVAAKLLQDITRRCMPAAEDFSQTGPGMLHAACISLYDAFWMR